MRHQILAGWAGFLTLGLVSVGWADVTLYAGQPAAEAGIALRSWGAGTIEDSTETTFVGSRSIKVLTRGMLSGGWVIFNRPVDLRADLNASDKVIRFTIRFPSVSSAAGGASGAGGLSGAGGAPRGGPGFGGEGGAPRGGPGFGGGLQGPGTPSGSSGGQATPPSLRELRIVFETSDGKRTETILPLQNLRTDETGWQSVSLPLSAVAGLRNTNGQIAKLGLFGDTTGVFYIGEIRTLSESSPLRGYIAVQNTFGSVFTSRSQSRLSIASGDELVFFGVVEGVSIPVEYRWSFSDDPSQVDGVGNVVRRRFPKRGTYTVHLTIADPHGNRPPATAKIEIQVN